MFPIGKCYEVDGLVGNIYSPCIIRPLGQCKGGATCMPSSQAKGTNSASFLTHKRKERSGVSTLGLRRCMHA